MLQNSSTLFPYVKSTSPDPGKAKCLIITPFKTIIHNTKLPALKRVYNSPRKIPTEYLFSEYSMKAKLFSKTPIPFQKKLYSNSMPKDFVLCIMNKIQHKPLVLNLTPVSDRRIMCKSIDLDSMLQNAHKNHDPPYINKNNK